MSEPRICPCLGCEADLEEVASDECFACHREVCVDCLIECDVDGEMYCVDCEGDMPEDEDPDDAQ